MSIIQAREEITRRVHLLYQHGKLDAARECTGVLGLLNNVPDYNEEPTLRDEFAKAALLGLIASPRWNDLRPEQLGQYSYEIADAMLKAREGND